jgi:hypothetical protein
MNEYHQWKLPTKGKGTSLIRQDMKTEPAYAQALDELAAKESVRIGRLVSRATIVQALTTRDSAWLRAQRSSLRTRYTQLKRGKPNESTTIHESSISQAE